MTRNVVVSEDTLREHFEDTLIAELTATVAACNMVSRFLAALHIHTADREKLPRSTETTLA